MAFRTIHLVDLHLPWWRANTSFITIFYSTSRVRTGVVRIAPEIFLKWNYWDTHDQQLNYIINWRIVEKTSGFNPITLQCKICLSEIVNIFNPTLNPNQSSLNKRHETFSHCRHLKKYVPVLLNKIFNWKTCCFLK